MTAELDALVSERERDIERLRVAFRFSHEEAIDFLERYGTGVLA